MLKMLPDALAKLGIKIKTSVTFVELQITKTTQWVF